MAAEPRDTELYDYDAPDPPLYDEDGEPVPIAFRTQSDYEAWLERHPEQRAFVAAEDNPAEEFRRQLAAWRAAGNEGLPPGWITRTEYERQRALRSNLQ
jgi:hypothetical protein